MILQRQFPQINNIVVKSQYPASSTAESTYSLKGSVLSTSQIDSTLRKQPKHQAQAKAEMLTLNSKVVWYKMHMCTLLENT